MQKLQEDKQQITKTLVKFVFAIWRNENVIFTCLWSQTIRRHIYIYTDIHTLGVYIHLMESGKYCWKEAGEREISHCTHFIHEQSNRQHCKRIADYELRNFAQPEVQHMSFNYYRVISTKWWESSCANNVLLLLSLFVQKYPVGLDTCAPNIYPNIWTPNIFTHN